jgi:hypothetical protein
MAIDTNNKEPSYCVFGTLSDETKCSKKSESKTNADTVATSEIRVSTGEKKYYGDKL